jgi:DEAD/DEAH box helicase domain-containing protein
VWNGFLRLYNLFQFLPFTYFITKDGIKKKSYNNLRLFNEDKFQEGVPVVDPEKEEWSDIKEMVDDALHGILDKLEKQGWAVPEAGYELEGINGEIVACAELAWAELKIAFLMKEELVGENHFRDAGWRTIPMNKVIENPDEYMLLNKQKRDDLNDR